MDKQNHILNHHYNGASLRSKVYFRDIEGTINAQSPFRHHHHNCHHTSSAAVSSFLPPSQSDYSICDSMNKCHLTETWAMNHQYNLPIAQVPILTSFATLQSELELHVNPAICSFYHQQQFVDAPSQSHYLQQQQLLQQHHNYQTFYKHYLDRIYSSFEEYKCASKMADVQSLNSEGTSQQHPLNDDLPRNEGSYFEENMSENIYDSECRMSSDANDANEPEIQHRIKTSIKFQDRNKKLDFKINFRDENRKINGCFYDSDRISPRSRSVGTTIAPPKKKWLKTHFLSSQAGRHFCPIKTFLKR
jgi:hypothetical protein